MFLFAAVLIAVLVMALVYMARKVHRLNEAIDFAWAWHHKQMAGRP